jgi:hypothetical protein
MTAAAVLRQPQPVVRRAPPQLVARPKRMRAMLARPAGVAAAAAGGERRRALLGELAQPQPQQQQLGQEQLRSQQGQSQQQQPQQQQQGQGQGQQRQQQQHQQQRQASGQCRVVCVFDFDHTLRINRGDRWDHGGGSRQPRRPARPLLGLALTKHD